MNVPVSFIVAARSGNVVGEFNTLEKAKQFVDNHKKRNDTTTLRVLKKTVTFEEV